eukprot:scaffold4159_cov62-Phaeocystis_antarctica.AAC.1
MVRQARTPQGLSDLHYEVGSTPYTLQLVQLTQLNKRTGVRRSVSFFGQGGKVADRQPLVHGTQELRSNGPSRDDAVAEQTAKLHASDLLKPPHFAPTNAVLDARAREALLASLAPRDERFERIAVLTVHEVSLTAERREAFNSASTYLESRYLRSRGANVQHAFHGSSLAAVASIACDGFVSTNTLRNAAQFGKGIYLSPVGSTQGGRIDMMAASVQYASLDADRVQHVLFCKVITGEPEQVRDGGAAGSDQVKPSTELVDTGVDRLVRKADGSVDFTQAARLVVWTNKMNEFILPEAIVSFRIESTTEDSD